MSGGVFMDGTRITPGSEACVCKPDCEFPCWQRVGWAPPCGECKCPQVVIVEKTAVFTERPRPTA